GSESRRLAGAGKHSHGDLLPEPDVRGAARKMGARELARRSAASPSAGGTRVETARRRRQAAHDAPADGSASGQPYLSFLPFPHGSDRICARELRRRRKVAVRRERDADRRFGQASWWGRISRARRIEEVAADELS